MARDIVPKSGAATREETATWKRTPRTQHPNSKRQVTLKATLDSVHKLGAHVPERLRYSAAEIDLVKRKFNNGRSHIQMEGVPGPEIKDNPHKIFDNVVGSGEAGTWKEISLHKDDRIFARADLSNERGPGYYSTPRSYSREVAVKELALAWTNSPRQLQHYSETSYLVRDSNKDGFTRGILQSTAAPQRHKDTGEYLKGGLTQYWHPKGLRETPEISGLEVINRRTKKD